ncbi:GbsR/MarR family transcriptional regulator [Streptomyces sp. NPDC058653]|uniref:GbsR/MarR family transcriptional regulator n=1 Tax=Streptomyces sp. NPDC058653 TaxID=3346576 RepID=UPI003662CA39
MSERRQEDGRDESRDTGHEHRSDRDEAAVSQFVEAFAAQLTEAGMARMPARVFVALLASEKGVMSSAELGEQLQVSPAAVSGAVRYLSQANVNMVTREREPGSRRERYRVLDNQWYETLTNRDIMLRRWQETMREGVAFFGIDTPQGRRINETLQFFLFLEEQFDSMMARWKTYRAEHIRD